MSVNDSRSRTEPSSTIDGMSLTEEQLDLLIESDLPCAPIAKFVKEHRFS